MQGTEDNVAPVVMSEYAERLLPQVELHKLEGEGHYSWFFNCDQCHRELFKTLFGEVAGLEELDNPVVPEDSASKEPEKVQEPEKSEDDERPIIDLQTDQRADDRTSFLKEADEIASGDDLIGLSQEVKPKDEL